jgi:hypothetical protein
MEDWVYVFLILAVYLIISIGGVKVTVWATKKYKPVYQIIIRSFSYSIIFGIGAAGGGGDPGFALPCPIIIAIFMSHLDVFLYNIITPLVFWWLVIFSVLFIRYWIRRRNQKNEIEINAT